MAIQRMLQEVQRRIDAAKGGPAAVAPDLSNYYTKDQIDLTCKGIAGCQKLPYPGGTAHKPGTPAKTPLATVRVSNEARR